MTDQVEDSDLPLDLEAIRRDDALIEAIGRGSLRGGPIELVRLLAGWRMEVLANPACELMDVEEARAVIAAAHRHQCDWWCWTKRVVELLLYMLVAVIMLSWVFVI